GGAGSAGFALGAFWLGLFRHSDKPQIGTEIGGTPDEARPRIAFPMIRARRGGIPPRKWVETDEKSAMQRPPSSVQVSIFAFPPPVPARQSAPGRPLWLPVGFHLLDDRLGELL